MEKTTLIRVRAGISFALAEAMDDGHCGLPADELILLAQKLLEVPPISSRPPLVLSFKMALWSPMILVLSIGPKREIAEKLLVGIVSSNLTSRARPVVTFSQNLIRSTSS